MHHLEQRGLFPVVFFAVHIGTHDLKRQSAFNKHHLAISPMGHTLRFEVHRFDGERVVRPFFFCRHFFRGFFRQFSHQLADKYLAGSTGLP